MAVGYTDDQWAVFQPILNLAQSHIVHVSELDAADRVLDMGPGPGERGGKVIFNGSPEALMGSARSLTAGLVANQRPLAFIFNTLHRLDPGATIAGVVRDENGQPVPGATVFEGRPYGWQYTCKSDADGNYEVCIANRDVGHKNLLDTAGHRAGFLLARHLLVKGEIAPITTQVMYEKEYAELVAQRGF